MKRNFPGSDKWPRSVPHYRRSVRSLAILSVGPLNVSLSSYNGSNRCGSAAQSSSVREISVLPYRTIDSDSPCATLYLLRIMTESLPG